MIYLAISVLALALMYLFLGIMHLCNRTNKRRWEKVGIGIMVALMYGGCWLIVSGLINTLRCLLK